MITRTFRRLTIPLAAIFCIPIATQAKVTRVEITSRAPITGTFGAAGRYELITGRFFGEVDPKDPKNAIITDLKLAPRDARGLVDYSATFQIAKPVDMSKASGFLLYDVPNRGNGRAEGNADGHINVVSGWQGDIPDNPRQQTMTVPVARHPDGSPVTGPVVVRLLNMPKGASTVAMTGGIGAGTPRPAPLSLDTKKAKLIRRSSDRDPGTVIPAGDWAFADCSSTPFPGKPDAGHVCLKAGFDPAYAYEVTYTAKDPLVLGLGFAATRDLNTFLRYSPGAAGAPNPVAGQVKWALARGVSQSGNYLRTYLNLGFNQGEDGKVVFDGMNPHIAGRQVPLNIRFGVPGGASSLYDAGSEGALWWARYDDKVRGLGTTSLLDRCNATKTCPKIIETFGSTEFWGLRMSPDLIGTDAKADLPLPANVRRYFLAGTTHGGGPGGFDVIARDAKGTGQCNLPANPNPQSDETRALMKALAIWVAKGTEPPLSNYPTLAKGDLVLPTSQSLGFPTIPGAPSPDGKFLDFFVYDYGPGYIRKDTSGLMTKAPPAITYGLVPSRAPRVDSDGNETSGIRSVQLQAPLGTYVGWNVQATGYYAGQQCGFTGGFIPFEATKAERLASGDPRPSLEERYASHADYVARVKTASVSLVSQGYLLQDDADRLVAQAQASNVLKGR
jgi:hypothetical protein